MDKDFPVFRTPEDIAARRDAPLTENQLRENVRKALNAYRDHYVTLLNDDASLDEDYDHYIASKVQVESAMRILWMDR